MLQCQFNRFRLLDIGTWYAQSLCVLDVDDREVALDKTLEPGQVCDTMFTKEE